jgi:hypothetical protein
MSSSDIILSAAGAAGGDVNYIDECFSTYLYTGNSSTQTITNGIDLSGKGGLVWIKNRGLDPSNNFLFDTIRGAGNYLRSNQTSAEGNFSPLFSSFNNNGFSLNGTSTDLNATGNNYCSWTFREQAKFFDVVTWTGNGAGGGQVISHNLGSTPGLIICKSTSAVGDWAVCARTGGASSPVSSITYATGLSLNSTGAALYSGTLGNYPTSTTFDTAGIFDNSGNYPNSNGVTYIAYLFAHNAGGFGTAGTDNVISCGSFTTDGSAYANVNLGYEPQWVLQKRTDSTQGWYLTDNMRGSATLGGQCAQLFPNTSGAESSGTGGAHPTATGFESTGLAVSGTFIYIAIRRGPMKVPTTGTSVFSAVSRTGTSANATVSASISPVDMVLETARNANFGTAPNAFDRLRGANQLLITSTTGSEVNTTTTPTLTGFDVQDGFKVGDDSGGYGINYSPYIFINWNFKRAPSVFDVVCYTGTASTQNVAHNLAVAPELLIVRGRSIGTTGEPWVVYAASQNQGVQFATYLNSTVAYSSKGQNFWGASGSAVMTSTTFSVGDAYTSTNGAGETYVAYLFATCPGVSKVGSYTGNGTTQAIACGFTGGARFVLIRRTDSTGNWFVYDTVRGMTVLTDPYLLLNSSAAEVATLGSVTTTTGGFTVDGTVLGAINTNAASYIFLAIA